MKVGLHLIYPIAHQRSLYMAGAAWGFPHMIAGLPRPSLGLMAGRQRCSNRKAHIFGLTGRSQVAATC